MVSTVDATSQSAELVPLARHVACQLLEIIHQALQLGFKRLVLTFQGAYVFLCCLESAPCAQFG